MRNRSGSESWRRTIYGARRRSYADRRAGNWSKIQFLLGHESILTTERYLGCEQDLKNAVNDALVFERGLDIEPYVRWQLLYRPSARPG